MTNTLGASIKKAAAQVLKGLVSSGTIKGYQMQDYIKNMQDLVFPSLPWAVLSTPSAVDSKIEYNASNMRTYQFDILVVARYEDTQSPIDVETLMDQVMLAFDETITLLGVANCGLEPAIVQKGTINTGERNLICFNVRIRAKALQPLTFNF